MNTIAEQWGVFEARVIPKDAPQVQRLEMKRAFYGGAAGLLSMMLKIADSGMSDEAGGAVMDGWEDECQRFAQEVKRGAA